MITINGISFEWTDGMNMQQAIDTALADARIDVDRGQLLLYVKNKSVFEASELKDTLVADGDDISVFSLLGGG